MKVIFKIIRWKVFLPVLGIFLLTSWVVIYKIDTWLKDWLESGISAVTETKTDISRLHLSFANSSLKIGRLEIASKTDEFKNAVEFEEIVIDFQTLPLLRKRFVIDDFSILGIQWGTNRKTSGWIPKPPPPKKPSWFAQMSNKAFTSLKKEFDATPAGKLLDFKIPTNPKDIVETLDLQSVDKYKDTVVLAQNLRSKWNAKIKELRNVDEYKTWIEQARQQAQNVPQSPEEILKRIEFIKGTIDTFDREVKRVESLVEDVKTDAAHIQDDFKAALDAVSADYNRAKDLVSLDQLKVDNLSRLLFGAHWVSKAEEVLRYHQMLRQALAKTDKDQNVQVQQRAKGRDIVFIVPKKQPSFVLAHSAFTVKAIEKGQRNLVTQTYELKLEDVNSSPRLYGKPTSVDVKAQFKNALIGEAVFNGFWDYTKDDPTDIYKVAVNRIKADSWPVGIPKVFPIKLASGLADSSSELRFDGPDMKWVTKVNFSDVSWDLSEVTRTGVILPVLEKVFSKIKNFYLTMEFKIVKDEMVYDVGSDLDDVIQRAISEVIAEKMKEFQQRLHQEIERRVAQVKEQALKEMNGFQKEVQGRIDSSVQELNKYKSEANGLIDSLKKKAAGAATDELKKNIPKVDNPFKNFKKPF